MSAPADPPAKVGLRDTLADQVIESTVQAALFGHDAAPVHIGRFRVVRSLGGGAMGTVWLARDDELDRDIAVKLLRRGLADDPGSRERLLREARALAKLSDPHVVVVHEVGQTERGVYVAMELVRGTTLTEWLAAQQRAPADILGVVLQAGRGLAAAHRLGLVHRDFKPDNVLVGADGRAKVVDFGLARSEGVDDRTESQPRAETGARPRGDRLALTQIGTLLGTPAYMAPEQLAGAPADAKSDQFAFCVTVHEALGGTRPFVADDVEELLAAMHEGRRSGAASPLPSRVRAALERGLAIDPAARWPDMDALLHALGPRRSPRVVTLLAAAATVGIAALAAFVWLAPPSCDEAGDRFAAAWDAPTRARTEAAVLESTRPFAADVWHSTATVLDRYADELDASARAVCSAASTFADDDTRARAQWCLEQADAERTALVTALQQTPDASVAAALHRATALPDVHGCSDPRRLARTPVPTDDVSRTRVEEARAQLAEARERLAALAFGDEATGFTDHLAAGARAADTAVALADPDAPTVLAAALVARARFAVRRGDSEVAESDLQRALELTNVLDDPILRVHAALQLLYVIGSDRDRADEAYALGDQIGAFIDAAGDSRLLRAQLHNHLGTIAARDRRDHHEQALAHHREALALMREQLGDAHPDTLASRTNLASALAQAGLHDEAKIELEAALAPARATWGDDHPNVGRIHGVLGNVSLRAGDYEEAEASMRTALQTHERALGPDDAEVASALYNLAMVLVRRDRHAEAVTALRRGLALRERLVGPDSSELIVWLVALGEAELGAGAAAPAETELRRALALCETDGAPPMDFARVRLALARALIGRAPAEARVLAESARAAYAGAGRTKDVERAAAVLAELPR